MKLTFSIVLLIIFLPSCESDDEVKLKETKTTGGIAFFLIPDLYDSIVASFAKEMG